MTNFKKIQTTDLMLNPFSIANDWLLITAGDTDSFNTMTASWGGFGVLWHKDVATVYIRPQRYTFEFVEKNDSFTLCFFNDSFKDKLKFCGANSGRDVDKTKECNFSPIKVGNSVGFEEAALIIVCKKIYFNDLNSENFLCDDIMKNYSNNDFHRMYIGEIQEVYLSENN